MKIRTKEILCVIALVVFIFVATDATSSTDKTAQNVAIEVIDLIESKEIKLFGDNDFKEEFSLDTSSFSSVSFYSCEQVMSVEQLLVVKLNDGQNADDLINQIATKLQEKLVLFQGYAPEQADLLNQAIISKKGDFVFFCVAKNADECFDKFKSAISN